MPRSAVNDERPPLWAIALVGTGAAGVVLAFMYLTVFALLIIAN